MSREHEPTSAGEEKIQEYVARIRSGESKEEILAGLPASFTAGIEAGLAQRKTEENFAEHSPDNLKTGGELKVPPQYEGLDADTLDFIWTIPEYVDPDKTTAEKERKAKVLARLRKEEGETQSITGKKNAEEARIAEIKNELGIGSGEPVEEKRETLATAKRPGEKEDRHMLRGLLKYVTAGRKQVVLDLYEDFLKNFDNPEVRKQLVSSLFQDVYNKYRVAEYPTNPEEEKIWEDALKSTKVPVNNRKSEWQYRGIFPEKGEETVTRGSFNVHVTPELIDSLDSLIATGQLKANYKFGQPNTAASPSERHDAISIYFLEEPSEEQLEELSDLIKPYVRGDNLLGRKIGDGFFMSEIGSVESGHIDTLVEKLGELDPAFAGAVKQYVSPRTDGQKRSLQMSEAQFYAIKDVARAFGYSLSYDKEEGFQISH